MIYDRDDRLVMDRSIGYVLIDDQLMMLMNDDGSLSRWSLEWICRWSCCPRRRIKNWLCLVWI